MTDSGAGHAAASDQCPTWAACEANLRDIVRLRNRRRRYCLRRSCDGYDKASSSNQPDHSYPPSLPWAFFSLAVGAPNSGLCLGARLPSFSSEGKGNQYGYYYSEEWVKGGGRSALMRSRSQPRT